MAGFDSWKISKDLFFFLQNGYTKPTLYVAVRLNEVMHGGSLAQFLA